ncbi:MAG: helix-turn-helix transcriptional regulator [Clostridium sp.]|nr:helix-turn-helix transcriptional regulator [Clostridium sp.]
MLNLCYLGENLFKLRNKFNHSQSFVSDMLHIDRSLLSKYEHSISIPTLPTLIKLANFYNVSIDYLLSNHNKI